MRLQSDCLVLCNTLLLHLLHIHFCFDFLSPGHAVHGLLVDWGYHEADRGHRRLVSRAVQDLPVEGLRVVEECTLVSFVDGDLKHNPWLINAHIKEGMLKFCSHSGLWIFTHHCVGMRAVLTSCCLKSQTAWIGNLPLTEVVGLRGFSWMMDLALLFRPVTSVLNSFSCSLSSWWNNKWINTRLE